MKHILFFLLAFLTLNALSQTTYYSSQSGSFRANGTWQGNNDPGTTISSNEVVYINHDVYFDRDLTIEGILIINGGASLITNNNKDFSVENGGKVIANGLLAVRDFFIQDNNSRVEINDSLFVENSAEIQNGKFILNGSAFFEGDRNDPFLINDADSIFIGGNLTAGNFDGGNEGFIIEGNTNLIIATTGFLNVDDEIRVKDNVVFSNFGALLVEEDFRVDDNASITLGGTVRINNDLTTNDNSTLLITGNLYVADNFELDNNANISIGSTGLVEVIGALEHDGNNLIVDGALVIRDVNNDGSFLGNGETLTGSGLIQIDGAGLSNNGGTINGTLDICSSDASSNPLSGSNPSNSVTICTSSGINFPIIPAAPLPVEMAEFYAVKKDGEIDLIWITLSELNSSYFLIEHSDDGLLFSEIGELSAQGNSNSPTTYSFTHLNPTNGANYYRLVQFDKDGKFEEFAPIFVEYTKKRDLNKNIAIYPNPNNGYRVFVEIPENDPENISVLVNNLYKIDEVGDITFINQIDKGLIILEFDEKLNSGIYIINFLIGQNIYSEKLIVE